jgi:hypothetical protein
MGMGEGLFLRFGRLPRFLLEWVSFVVFSTSLNLVAFFADFALADTLPNAAEAELKASLSKIGFDEIVIDVCIVQAGIDRPPNSKVSRFEFNINLSYLDFSTFEIVESSTNGENIFSGIVRFGENFRLLERLRREFRFYVRDQYLQDWTADQPPLFGKDYLKIESDLQSSGIAQDTFYRFNSGETVQTFPYYMNFYFLYHDQEILVDFLKNLEVVALSNHC